MPKKAKSGKISIKSLRDLIESLKMGPRTASAPSLAKRRECIQWLKMPVPDDDLLQRKPVVGGVSRRLYYLLPNSMDSSKFLRHGELLVRKLILSLEDELRIAKGKLSVLEEMWHQDNLREYRARLEPDCLKAMEDVRQRCLARDMQQNGSPLRDQIRVQKQRIRALENTRQESLQRDMRAVSLPLSYQIHEQKEIIRQLEEAVAFSGWVSKQK